MVHYDRVRYGARRCGAVLCGRVRYGTVRCGAVRCEVVWGFAVRDVGFGWLFLLIRENLSDHVYVFLVVELIFILFRKGLCQQIEHVIVFFPIMFDKTPYGMSS